MCLSEVTIFGRKIWHCKDAESFSAIGLLTINANKFSCVIRTTKQIKFDCTLYLHVESQPIIIFDVCSSHKMHVCSYQRNSLFFDISSKQVKFLEDASYQTLLL